MREAEIQVMSFLYAVYAKGSPVFLWIVLLGYQPFSSSTISLAIASVSVLFFSSSRCFFRILPVLYVVVSSLAGLTLSADILFPLLCLASFRNIASLVDSVFLFGLFVIERSLIPFCQNVPQIWDSFHCASLCFLFYPTLVLFLFLLYKKEKGTAFRLFVLSLILSFAIVFLGISGILSPSLLSSEPFRICILLTICVTLAVKQKDFSSLIYSTCVVKKRELLLSCLGICISVLVLYQIPKSSIEGVVFDEAHGEWETVLNTLNPNSFGRKATYTYSHLYRISKILYPESDVYLSENAPLPDTNKCFFVKTPTKPFGDAFKDSLENWVSQGGKLIVVADHTDLYDTTHNLNQLIERMKGPRIRADASFDNVGFPLKVKRSFAEALHGKVNANDISLQWLTGATLENIGLRVVELCSSDVSFSALGNYSRTNRFSSFNPSIELRYLPHSTLVAYPYGKGMVTILLDSTPWSNFSVYKEEYTRLFETVIRAQTASPNIHLTPLLNGFIIVACILLLSFKARAFSFPCLCIALSAVLTNNLCIGNIAWLSHSDNLKKIETLIVAGPSAKFSTMKELNGPTDENYCRLVFSLEKNDIFPYLAQSDYWDSSFSQCIIVNPATKQLPDAQDVNQFLSSGKNLVVLFSKDQSRDEKTRAWLSSLGLRVNIKSDLQSLIVQTNEDSSPFSGRKKYLSRIQKVAVKASPYSIYKEEYSDQYGKAFVIRPSQLKGTTSGVLYISFNSDEFSDFAIGDIWEGSSPSVVGAFIENYFSAVVKGLPPYPKQKFVDNLSPSHNMPKNKITQLKNYGVWQNGIRIMSGNLSQEEIGDALWASLVTLASEALSHAEAHTNKKAGFSDCTEPFISSDNLEWHLRVYRESGAIKLIELIHNASYGGTRGNFNVVFTM